MKKRFATSFVAAVLGLTGVGVGAGTAQAAAAPAVAPSTTSAAAPSAASANGSPLAHLPSLPGLSSLPTLVLNEVVSVGRLIHDWK